MSDNEDRSGRQTISLVDGLAEAHRSAAAAQFIEARHGFLDPELRDGPEAQALHAAALDPAFIVSAVAADGRLLGFAGLSGADGAFWHPDRVHPPHKTNPFRWLWRGGRPRAAPIGAGPRNAHRRGEGALRIDGLYVSGDARELDVAGVLVDGAIAAARRADKGFIEAVVEHGQGKDGVYDRAREFYARHGFQLDDAFELTAQGGRFFIPTYSIVVLEL